VRSPNILIITILGKETVPVINQSLWDAHERSDFRTMIDHRGAKWIFFVFFHKWMDKSRLIIGRAS
jgi:hypothetical protein